MVNLRGLVKLDQLNAALKQLKTNITAWQRSMSGANTTFGKFSQTASDAARNMKVLQQANSALAATNAKMASSQQRVQSTTQKLTAAQKEAIRIRRDEIRLDNLKIKSSDNLATRLRKVETAYDSIFRAGFRLQMLGNQMEQLGMQAAKMLGGFASEFGDFEFMINRAAGAMGILQTEVDGGVNVYQKFQQQILATSQELRLFKPEEVAKATYYWASTSGQQVDTLQDMEVALKAVNPLMKIAALTQTDYETAIKGVYSIIVQYGLGLEDVQMVTEQLQKTTVETAAEFPDLINSFKMVGPIAKANNVTFQDMVDLFGKLADAGIRGSMSGRAFRQLFIQLVKPSELAKKALDELWQSTKAFGGKSYTETVFPQGEFVGVTKYVNLLAQALKNETSAQRNALLARITTANELPVLTALVDREVTALNTHTDAWDKGAKSTETAAEAFKRQWDILANSWNGLVGQLQRGVDTLQILIGQRIAAIFGPIVKEITNQLQNLGDWFANPENQEIIDFFVKLASAAAGLLPVSGFVIKFAGSLTILGAGLVVLIRAFGVFASKVLVLTGIFAGLAEAVQRNWDYVQDAIVSAWNDINAAFNTGEMSVKNAQDAFEAFSAAVRPIFDFIVRTTADIIRSFGSLVKTLMTFGPTAAVIEALGKALIFAFAAKTVANVLGLGKALGMFNLVAAKTTLVVAGVSKNGLTLGGSLKGAVGGVKGLTGAFKGLAGAIGPLGIVALGIALGGLAYDVFPPLKQAIDGVAESFRDFRKDANDALAALDLWRGRVEASLFNEGEYKALESRLHAITEELYNPDIQGQQALDLKKQYDQIIKDMEDFKRDYAKQWSSLTTELRESGIDVTQEDILKKADDFAKGLGLQSLRDAIPFVKAYFKAIQQGTDNGTDQLTELEKVWRDTVLNIGEGGTGPKISLEKFLDLGLGPGGRAKALIDKQVKELMSLYVKSTSGGEGFKGWTEEMRSQLLAKIVEMRGRVSPELASQINEMLDGAVRNGVVLDEEGLDTQAEEVAQVTSQSLLDAFSSGLDLDKQIAEIMKKRLMPKQQTKEVFKSFVSGAISKGFESAKGETNYAARLFAQEQVGKFGENWQMYLDQLSAPKATKFINDTIAQFNSDFKNGVPATVPLELRQEMEDFMTMVYKEAGIPMPPEVLQKIWGSSIIAGQKVPAGMTTGLTDPTLNQNLSESAITMRDDTLAKLNVGTVPYDEGAKIPDGYSEGITSGKPDVVTAADAIRAAVSGISPSLSAVFTWGQHLIQRFLSGMQSVDIERIPQQIAAKVGASFKFSEPKEGPLRGMKTNGQHYIQNFLDGMESMQRSAQITADNVAQSLAINASSFAPNGVNFTMDNQRVIKVEIEVTSPDGSVDRIKTAQLQQAIQTSELVLALEHMATVG